MLPVHDILLLAKTQDFFAHMQAIEAGLRAGGMPGRGPWSTTSLGNPRLTGFKAVSDASAQV